MTHITKMVNVPITKVDDEKRYVFGWANVPVPGEMSKAADEMSKAAEDSIEGHLRKVYDTYYAKFSGPEMFAYVLETYDTYVIAAHESWDDGIVKCTYFKHAYVMEGDSVAFGDGEEVERAWVAKQFPEYERLSKLVTVEAMDEITGRILEAYSARAKETYQAAAPKIDYQGDIVPSFELEEAAYDFVIKSREGSVNHTGEVVSEMIESFYATAEKYEKMGIDPEVAKSLHEGWWIGFHVVDDEVWKGVKDGTYKMFSIGGSAYRDELDS